MTAQFQTALDQAHARMVAAGEGEAARRAFYTALAAAELTVVLEAEAGAEVETGKGQAQIRPLVLPTEDAGQIVLAFDTEARLAEFIGRGAAIVTLTGRQLAAQLAPARLGLGLNLEVAPSAILLPASAMVWLAEGLSADADPREERITAIAPPQHIPEALLAALDARLATLSGRADVAYLAEAGYMDGTTTLLLALTGVAVGERAGLAGAIAEVQGVAGLPGDPLDVVFVTADGPLLPQLEAQALRIDLPQPAAPPVPKAPGRNPDIPPKLR